MKNVQYLIILLLLLCGLAFLLYSHPNDEITKVELARSGAWQDRGGAISVDRLLRCNFYYTYLDSDEKPTSGYYTGNVSLKFWDTLNRKLSSIDYKNVPAIKDLGTSDVNYYELIITWKNGKRRIVREENFNSTDSLDGFIKWLDHSYKRVHFIEKSKKPLKFETTYQYELPMPKLNGVKFLPPN